MENKKQNKKLIVTSLVSVVLCGILLISATFAWFTDKVTSADNSIEAGTFDLEVAVVDVTRIIEEGEYEGAYSTLDEDGKYTYVDLSKEGKFIIDADNWEPGQSDAKYIQIHNNGTLAMEVAINLTTEGDLTDALWFSLYTVDDIDTDNDGGDDASYLEETLCYKVSAEELVAYFSDYTIALEPDEATSGSEEFTNEAATALFILEYGMYEEAGNEYQETSFSADFEFAARQYTFEEDGFGSDQYDANATYDNAGWVTLPTEVAQALAEAETTAEKSTILVDAGIIASGASNTYVEMIADGEFNIESGVTLSQGSNVTVNMLSGYDDDATVTMTAQSGTSNSGISMTDDGWLTIGTSNSSGVLKYDVVVTAADGTVLDSYVATFMSINFSGPDAYPGTDLIVGVNEIEFTCGLAKAITQYSAIKDEIVSYTVYSDNATYITVNNCSIVEGSSDYGNFVVNFTVNEAIPSGTTVRLYAKVELSDGSTHTISMTKINSGDFGN